MNKTRKLLILFLLIPIFFQTFAPAQNTTSSQGKKAVKKQIQKKEVVKKLEQKMVEITIEKDPSITDVSGKPRAIYAFLYPTLEETQKPEFLYTEQVKTENITPSKYKYSFKPTYENDKQREILLINIFKEFVVNKTPGAKNPLITKYYTAWIETGGARNFVAKINDKNQLELIIAGTNTGVLGNVSKEKTKTSTAKNVTFKNDSKSSATIMFNKCYKGSSAKPSIPEDAPKPEQWLTVIPTLKPGQQVTKSTNDQAIDISHSNKFIVIKNAKDIKNAKEHILNPDKTIVINNKFLINHE